MLIKGKRVEEGDDDLVNHPSQKTSAVNTRAVPVEDQRQELYALAR
jgi:hypothetical protein